MNQHDPANVMKNVIAAKPHYDQRISHMVVIIRTIGCTPESYIFEDRNVFYGGATPESAA